MTLLQGIKKWPFSGINFSGGFLDLFLEVLTGINLLLRFLYKLSKKYQLSSSLRKISTCVKVILPNVCVKCT